MNELIRLLLASLAVYRLAELIAVDDGPGDVLLQMRARLGAYYLGDDKRPDTGIGRAIICPYCLGIWLALPAALAVAPFDFSLVLWWLAIAGGQAFLQSVAGRV